MTLKTLEQHNADRLEYWRELDEASRRPHANGIACPKCGEEMFDPQPDTTLMSNPPQKHVACKCGYRGYRMA